MIHRFTQKNTSEDEMLRLIENGERLDFDKLWRKEDEQIKESLNTFFYNERWEEFDMATMLPLGVATLGIMPAIDSIVFAYKKHRRKKQIDEDINIDIITVSADEIFFFKDKIKEKVSELIKQGHKVSVVVDGCAQSHFISGSERIEYNFDTAKLIKLWDLNYELRQLGLEESIKFNEFFQTTKYSDTKTCWNLEQVIDANNEIDKVVRKIQDLKLSQYETMVYIHKYLTQNYGYGFNGSKRSIKKGTRKSEKSYSIIAAINNKTTICAGYASMTKAIVDRLNMPGLICKFQVASCWEYKRHMEYVCGHALNLVSIEDSKYNISGSYLNDATWDSKTKNQPRGRGYTFFMYPVTDMTKLKHTCLLNLAGGSRVINYPESFFDSDNIPENGRDCTPIPYDAFEKAVKRVYSLESDFCRNNDAEQTATEDIQLSLKRAWDSRTDDVNPLVKQVDKVYIVDPTYHKNGKLKNIKFTLKSQAINSHNELSQ